jgi:TonB family protein
MSIEEFRRLQGTPTRPTTVVNQRQPQRPVPAPTISRVDPSQLTSNLAMDSFDFSSVAVGQRDALQTYFEQLMQRLRNAFAPTAPLEARVEFRLERDGRLTNVRIIRSSGNEAFDQAALQACYRTRGPGTPPGNPPYTRTVTFNGVR